MDGFKTIGITGAGGFIGKELSKYLYKKGYPLVLFSEEEIIQDENIRYVKRDINQCCKDDFEGIESLIHLAGTSERENSFEKNFLLTKTTLEKAIDAKVSYFILMSSYAVYGDRETPAKTNEDLVPSDEYSLSKILSEYLLKKEINNDSIKGSIIRSCSIYGGGKGFLDLIKQKIRNKKEITINGYFERQYLNVYDLCHLVEEIMLKKESKGIYNIEGERISSKDIFNILKNSGVESSFENDKKKSYLCVGEKIKESIDVRTYLFP